MQGQVQPAGSAPGLVGGGAPRHQGVRGVQGLLSSYPTLCPCFGLCLMQTFNLSHLGSLLLKTVPERKREERVQTTTRERRWGGREQGAWRREPDPTREAQEWRVPTKAAPDRLDLRGAHMARVGSYWDPLLSWDSLDYRPSGCLWPGQDLTHTPPLSPHSTPSAEAGEGGVLAFPVIVPSLMTPGQC